MVKRFPENLVAWTLTASLLATPAIAQTDPAADYPNRFVRIVVAVEPGGGVDTVTRLLAEQVKGSLGQPFVIENRGGAAGNVGAQAVFQSKPDGYTLLASSLSPITITGLLRRNLAFEPAAFEPIVIMSRIPNVLVVRQNFPAKSVAELLTHAKANAGKVSYASPGVGTAAQLTSALFMQITGTQLIHVVYKGTAPSLIDLAGGHVDLTFAQIAAVYPLHKDGRVRILATATEKRLDILPDIPTLAEASVPGADSDTWNALSAPPKTPPAIIAKLNAAFSAVLSSPEIRARYRDMLLLTPATGNAAAVKKYVRDETARWSEVIRGAGLKAE